MKLFLFTSFLLVSTLADAQVYIQVKNVDNKATFEASIEVYKSDAETLQKASLDWIEKTFLSQDVITANTPGSISARFTQDYSDGTWSGEYEHMLHISINGHKVSFTITDTKMGLLRSDGSWKEHLGKMKAMYEQAANELFWSFETALQGANGKNEH